MKEKKASKIEAIFFDWAGTFVDYGSTAPAAAFVELFKSFDVPISTKEARAPMGADKRTHIEKILQDLNVQDRWEKTHNRQSQNSDVDKMYDKFLDIQIKCLKNHSDLIPGTLDVIKDLKSRSYKLGSTTGYTKEIMKHLIPMVEKQGFKPDSIVCASDVENSRPYPNMILQSMMELKVLKTSQCVKVDDTVIGIEEGLNAGCWTIGLALSGNYVGLSHDEWIRLPHEEKDKLKKSAYNKFSSSGAHFVVDSINDIIPCLNEIENKISQNYYS